MLATSADKLRADPHRPGFVPERKALPESDQGEGDGIVITYVPGRGTIVTAKGAEKGIIEGKDFADALFSVWLGRNPVQGGPEEGASGRLKLAG